jgi:hypothetical protein
MEARRLRQRQSMKMRTVPFGYSNISIIRAVNWNFRSAFRSSIVKNKAFWDTSGVWYADFSHECALTGGEKEHGDFGS